MPLRKVALDIYMLYKKYHGSISAITGFMGSEDITRLSKQINPNDEQRDNFYIELLKAHRAMMQFSPQMEEEIWHILECERASFREGTPCRKKETAEHINKLFGELGEVIYKHSTNAPQEELEKEAFDLIPAAKELYENIRGEQTKGEIQETYFPV